MSAARKAAKRAILSVAESVACLAAWTVEKRAALKVESKVGSSEAVKAPRKVLMMESSTAGL